MSCPYLFNYFNRLKTKFRFLTKTCLQENQLCSKHLSPEKERKGEKNKQQIGMEKKCKQQKPKHSEVTGNKLRKLKERNK